LSHIFVPKKDFFAHESDQAGMSRVYGGIHYMFDNTAGQKTGAAIGQLAIDWARADGADGTSAPPATSLPPSPNATPNNTPTVAKKTSNDGW
jgi:hypothetical protein